VAAVLRLKSHPIDMINQSINYKCSYCCSCRMGETVSLNCRLQRAYCSFPKLYMRLENHGGTILTGKNLRTRRNPRPSATLSATNPAWTVLVVKPGLRGERSMTNRLSHGTVYYRCCTVSTEMNMYLVLCTFIPRPVSMLVSIKVSS
jgi:hypothetical protein